MSMEPSRAACSRISSLVNMTVVVECTDMLQAHREFKVEMSIVELVACFKLMLRLG